MKLKTTPHWLETQILAETFKDEDLTVNVVVYSGAKVPRMNFWTGSRYELQLSLNPAHVRLERFNRGASVTRDHSRALEDVVGKVLPQSAKLTNMGLVATVQFSNRDDLAGFRKDVRAGIINKLSVEAFPHKIEVTQQGEGKVDLHTWVDWECQAVSFVAVQADRAAETMSATKESEIEVEAVGLQETTMNEAERLAAEKAAKDAKDAADAKRREELEAAKAEGARLESVRQKTVREVAKKAGLAIELADTWAGDPTCTIEKARELAIDAVATKAAGLAKTDGTTRLDVGQDEREKFIESAQTALQFRAQKRHPGGKPIKLENGAEAFAHMSLLRLAEECVLRSGRKVTNHAPDHVLRLAFHTSSDFPGILAGGINKSIRRQYEERPGSWEQWCARGTLRDFKSTDRNILSAFPNLEELPEGGTIRSGTLTEGKEVVRLKTYARRVGLGRQMIINDDLNAFDKVPGQAATAARRIESELVYYVIINANPTMGDSVALFNSAHGGNLITPVLALTALSSARTVIRNQKGLALEELDLTPRFLLVPPELETTAWQLCMGEIVAVAASSTNPFKGTLTPIVEGRMNNTTKSGTTTAWCMVCSSSEIDTVEVDHLEGSSGPLVMEHIDQDTLGVAVDVVHDVGAKALDFRGIVKSSGTV